MAVPALPVLQADHVQGNKCFDPKNYLVHGRYSIMVVLHTLILALLHCTAFGCSFKQDLIATQNMAPLPFCQPQGLFRRQQSGPMQMIAFMS